MTASTIYVQFTDSAQTAILAIFSCSQNTTVYLNQGSIPSTDTRYVDYYNSLGSLVNTSGLVVPGS